MRTLGNVFRLSRKTGVGLLLIGLAMLLQLRAQLFIEDDDDPYYGLGKEKAELVLRYMEVTSIHSYYHDVVESVIRRYQQMFPQIEPQFWREFKQFYTDPEDLLKILVPVYGKRLESGDLKSIIAFMESPAGRKYAAVLPSIGKEVAKEAAAFEENLNRKLLASLRDSGYAGF